MYLEGARGTPDTECALWGRATDVLVVHDDDDRHVTNVCSSAYAEPRAAAGRETRDGHHVARAAFGAVGR